MMDTTTSREEFEKWAAKNGYRMDLIPDGDIYSYSSTHCSWEAWQASRESIVVTLPKTCRDIAGEDAHLGSDETSFDYGINFCAEALRSAGLTVKGD